MNNELYEALKRINVKNLNEEELIDLRKLFMNTNNSLIRNHIAIIFSDAHYNKAIPYILEKISEKESLNKNGSLVYALQEMDVKKYFLSFINIIGEQEYEARLIAYSIIEKYSDSISAKIRQSALNSLKKYKVIQKRTAKDKGENSKLHFIEKIEELLTQHRSLKK